MNSLFTHVPLKRPRRSFFDLGHEKKLSFAPGKIVPILCQETVPGDTFRCNAEIALQFAPMLAPLIHRVDVVTRFFFVPNRLIWPNFNKEFITGGPEGTSTLQIPYFLPLSPVTGGSATSMMGIGSLSDYLGINPAIAAVTNPTIDAKLKMSCLPFRAYQLIYNEYFRNQNSEDEVDFSNLTDGNGTSAQLSELLTLRTMNWQHDYFTSTLPWTQRGNPVTIPIEGTATVTDSQLADLVIPSDFNTNRSLLRSTDGTNIPYPGAADLNYESVSNGTGQFTATAGILPNVTTDGLQVDVTGHTFADLNGINVSMESSGITIESLRRTARLQEWLEKNARAGARYIEQIISHFGVRSSDARLQRPEYLGGGRQLVQISNVLQTSGTTSDSPQANPSGYGSAYGMSNRFKYFCEEHGYIIGVCYVMPRTAYEQGIPRMFSHIDKFDYYFPEFAHLGEQDVKMKELYIGSDSPDPDAVFGYLPRYAEYKSALSSIHGDMRTTLDFWHWGRKFANVPAWNNQFMKYNDDRRIFNVEDPTADPIWASMYIDLKAKRPMPKFGVPYL